MITVPYYLDDRKSYYEGWNRYVANRPTTLDEIITTDTDIISNRPIFYENNDAGGFGGLGKNS